MAETITDKNTMITFREAFKGYNKEDVNSYLENMNIKFAAAEEDYKTVIFSQKEKLDSQSIKIDDYDHMRAELSKQKDDNAATARQLDDALLRIKELEKLLSILGEKNDLLKAENSALSQKLADPAAMAEKTEEQHRTEEKARLYDSMSAQLGNMLIVANSNAEKILREAGEEAEKIKSAATAEAETEKSESRENLGRLMTSASLRLENMSDSYISEYSDFIVEIQAELVAMLDSMKNKAANIQKSVSEMKSTVESELDAEYVKICGSLFADHKNDPQA